MEFNIDKNSDLGEKYNTFKVEVYDNQKNIQQEENENNVLITQKQDKIIENEKEEDNEIIIELEIKKVDDEEINILCDKDKLIEENKNNEIYYKKNNIEPLKIFDYFNENNIKLYLNNNEISFKYKLNLDKIGINNIKIISKGKLISLSSMFYNCRDINTIKFLKINTNNVSNMSNMFGYCLNLSNLDLSSFNTNNVNNMSELFSHCLNLSNLDLSSFNTNNITDMSWMFCYCFNLSNLDLTIFNTDKVINMSKMFERCNKLLGINKNKININLKKN